MWNLYSAFDFVPNTRTVCLLYVRNIRMEI